MRKYEQAYEEIHDSEDNGTIRFIKLYNVGEKIVTRRCAGYLPSQVAFYLMNVHINPRKIWLSRHSESSDQVGAHCRCCGCLFHRAVESVFPVPVPVASFPCCSFVAY